MALPRARLVVLVAACAVLLAACGGDDDSSAAATPTTAPLALDGPTWQLDDGSLAAPLAGATVTARFSDGSLTGSSGCNTYRATYRADPPRLTISPDVATTQKACAAAAMTVEQQYLGRLGDVASFRISADALTLADAAGKAVLAYHAVDAAAALRGGWSVTSYYTGSAVSSVVNGSELTMTFDADTVSGDAGCNTFHGPYTVAGDTIRIGPLAATARACADPALDRQEQQFLAAVQLATTYEVAGDRLDLFRPGHTYAVSATRS